MRSRLPAVLILSALMLAACSASGTQPSDAPSAAESGTSANPQQAAALAAAVEKAMKRQHLRSVIVSVRTDGQSVLRQAWGESLATVPATPDDHFRNGAVAISYIANLFLQLVDGGTLRLDDKLSAYLPDLRDADTVTLEQLARMTSGYPDHVQNPKFVTDLYANPFREWSTEELVELALETPQLHKPGTNWSTGTRTTSSWARRWRRRLVGLSPN